MGIFKFVLWPMIASSEMVDDFTDYIKMLLRRLMLVSVYIIKLA